MYIHTVIPPYSQICYLWFYLPIIEKFPVVRLCKPSAASHPVICSCSITVGLGLWLAAVLPTSCEVLHIYFHIFCVLMPPKRKINYVSSASGNVKD